MKTVDSFELKEAEETEEGEYPQLRGLFSPTYNPVPTMLQTVRPYIGNPFNLLFACIQVVVEQEFDRVG